MPAGPLPPAQVSQSSPSVALGRETAVPNFNRLARLYRWMEYLTFGPCLWLCRVHFLPQLARCRRALVLGDGDGRFTARLLRADANIQTMAIDASPRMIQRLNQAARPNRDRLTAEVADLRDWEPSCSAQCGLPYDLVVTHFFLDCLTTQEVTEMAKRLNPILAPNALWLVSEFAIPPTFFGRIIAAPLVAVLYFAFDLLTNLRIRSLPNHAFALKQAGWSLLRENRSLNGLLVSQLWQPALASRKDTPPQE